VNLSLSPEQEALAESLDRLLTKLSDPERVRELEAHGGFDAELWSALNELGVPWMASADGGATLVDLAVVAERCGAHLASAPVVESMVAARLGHDGAAFSAVSSSTVPWASVLDPIVLSTGGLVRGAAGDLVPTLGCRAAATVDRAAATPVDGDPALALMVWRALTACWLAGLARGALEMARRARACRSAHGRLRHRPAAEAD
jgi:hypothetical protein